jgi:hypothetical protein
MITQGVNVGGVSDSAQIGGSATAPTAGTNISGTLTPGAGTWLLYVSVGVGGGSPVAADVGNFQLMKNAAVLTKLPSGIGTVQPTPFGPIRVTLAAADTVSVQAVGNGTASVGYTAGILAIAAG